MGRRLALYGLDIETDTSVNGLDPEVAPIITVALSTPQVDELFTGPEPLLLADLDRRLNRLEPGVIVTWNGASFDLPFIAARARVWGVPLALRLQPTPSTGLEPLPGHDGCYKAEWGSHRHLDAHRLYHPTGRHRVRLGRRRPIDPEPAELDAEMLHANPSSDARLARILAERRWATARRSIDRLSTPADQLVS